MARTPAQTKPANPQPALDELDAVLRGLVGEHEQLLLFAAEHRRAIATADVSALHSCIGRQNTVVQRIADLERRRQAATASHSPSQTISNLAASAPEPARTRLLTLSATLRDLINRLHKEHRVMRDAAESLSSHMEGLMRQVCRKLSHAGTYARSGAVDARVQVVSALDLKS